MGVYRFLALVGLLTAGLACGGGGSPPVGDTPIEIVRSVDPTLVAPAPVAPSRWTAERARAVRADPVQFFLDEGCTAILPVDPDLVWEMDYPPPGDECTYREFDQNCAPDMTGCWTRSETCRDGCAAPCTECQGGCADTCLRCGGLCDGDAACLRACASDRAACRQTCMDANATCLGPECAAAYERCEQEASERRDRLCPDCDAIAGCVIEQMGKGEDWQACAARFPASDPECVSLCFPGY